MIEGCTLRIERSGDARFTLRTIATDTLTVVLWSPRRFPLALKLADPADWIDLLPPTAAGCLLEAGPCDLHLEQMDRRAYWLQLSRDGNRCGLSFESPAYVKARLLPLKQ